MLEHILSGPALWIVVAAASELIALNPKLKSNSVIQLVFQILNALKSKKR
jgi:hypothetical protein